MHPEVRGRDGRVALKSDKQEIADLRAQLTAQLQVAEDASAAAIPPEVAELATCLRRDEAVRARAWRAPRTSRIADDRARRRWLATSPRPSTGPRNTMHAVAQLNTGYTSADAAIASRAGLSAQADKVWERRPR